MLLFLFELKDIHNFSERIRQSEGRRGNFGVLVNTHTTLALVSKYYQNTPADWRHYIVQIQGTFLQVSFDVERE